MRGALVAALLVPLFAPVPLAAAAAQCATPAGVYRDGVGWAQRITDPARIWPLTNGTGQLIAVIGTGVDASNAQFAPGQVVPGSDASDCDGRGTFAAGIVGAQVDPATTFAGIAPGARILGLRYTQTTGGGISDGGPDPDALGTAITRAVDAGATVILVAVPAVRTTPGLESAVRNALSRNIVVVSPAAGDKPETRTYPTNLPGVIGVGAHDRAGLPLQAESGQQVLLAAPGNDLVSTAAGAGGKLGHRWGVADPAFAAAYVAGAVTLLRAYRPTLDPAQIPDRLARTANRPPTGGRDPRLGWGILDLHAAVTAEALPENTVASTPPGTVIPAAGPPEPVTHQRLPGLLGMVGVGLGVAGVVVVIVTRRWRSRVQ